MQVFARIVQHLSCLIDSAAVQVCRKIVREHLQQIYRNLCSGKESLVISTLLLLETVSSVGEVTATLLCQSFDWSLKPLVRFPSVVRKDGGIDTRKQFIRFVCSLLGNAAAGCKEELATRNFVPALFRKLEEDSNDIQLLLMQTCFQNAEFLSGRARVRLFSENNLSFILKLARSSDERVRDTAEKVMTGLCTVPGQGVCFVDNGWYLREKVHSKVLLRLVETLSPTEHLTERNLLVGILAANQELIPFFWKRIDLEPSISSKWAATAAVAKAILQLPIPTMEIDGSDPPSVDIVVKSIVPPSFSRSSQNKGLKSPNAILRLLTLQLIIAILKRLKRTKRLFAGRSELWIASIEEIENAVCNSLVDVQQLVSAISGQDNEKSTTLNAHVLHAISLYLSVVPIRLLDYNSDLFKLVGIARDSKVLQHRLLKLICQIDSFRLSQRKDVNFLAPVCEISLRCGSLHLLEKFLHNLFNAMGILEYSSDPLELEFWKWYIPRHDFCKVIDCLNEFLKRPARAIDLAGNSSRSSALMHLMGGKSDAIADLFDKFCMDFTKPFQTDRTKSIASSTETAEYVVPMQVDSTVRCKDLIKKLLREISSPDPSSVNSTLGVLAARLEEVDQKGLRKLGAVLEQLCGIADAENSEAIKLIVAFVIAERRTKPSAREFELLSTLFESTCSPGDEAIMDCLKQLEKMLGKLDCIIWFFGRRNASLRTSLQSGTDPLLCLHELLNNFDRKKIKETVDQAGISSSFYDGTRHFHKIEFVLCLLYNCLVVGPDDIFRTALECGLVSVALVSLSSADNSLREMGFRIMDVVYAKLAASGSEREKSSLLPFLDFVRSGIEDRSQRLPSIISKFAAKGIMILQNPSHYLYPEINRFMYQRPVLDITDVPLFYQLFGSTKAREFKREKSWILKLVASSLCMREDLDVLESRRYVIDIVMNYFLMDKCECGSVILDIVGRMIALDSAHVAKYALHEWILCGIDHCSYRRDGDLLRERLEGLRKLVEAK